MPSRVVREGLLDSQRYWSVTIEARQLFWHLMLVADDFGLMSLAPIFIRRRCFVDAPTDEKLDKLMAELHDADLLRVYEVGAARYGFIPRFQQKLRTDKAKCPMPPAQLYQDDPKAAEKFQKNSDVFRQMPGSRPASAGQPQRSCATEVEVKGEEKKRIEVESKSEGTGARQEKSGECVERPKWPFAEMTVEQWAQQHGIVQRESEDTRAYRLRVIQLAQSELFKKA